MSSVSIGYLGPYRLLNVVNTGQTSRLWHAYDDQNREFVGIKTLLDQFAKDKEQIQMLKWEFETARNFSHPKLILLKEFAWQGKVPYVVMEWFSAPNLKMWINRGYEQYCQYLPKLLPDMAESLLYMHGQGWLHRDVKPDNFLLKEAEDGKNGDIKLIDFAIAKKIATGFGRFVTFRKKTQGTASYMSPEQIRGLPPTPTMDIYSLGCTFYELLTGKVPFTGETMGDLLNKHFSAAPVPVTQRNRNVTPEFAIILKMMMAKTPGERPQSMADVLQQLRSVRLFRGTPSERDLA